MRRHIHVSMHGPAAHGFMRHYYYYYYYYYYKNTDLSDTLQDTRCGCHFDRHHLPDDRSALPSDGQIQIMI